MLYQIAEASSFLVVTGGGVEDIKVCKKAWIYPWQKCSVESISPFDFEITLQAMTIEKLQFSLPAVFTIGPEDEETKLRTYAKLLTGRSTKEDTRRQAATGRSHVQDIVKGENAAFCLSPWIIEADSSHRYHRYAIFCAFSSI